MISVNFFLLMFVLAWLTEITCTRFADKFCGILFTIVTLEIMLKRCRTSCHSILKLEKKFSYAHVLRIFIQNLSGKKKYCKFNGEKIEHTYFSANVSVYTFAYLLFSASAFHFWKVKVSFGFGKQLRQNSLLYLIKPVNTMTNL